MLNIDQDESVKQQNCQLESFKAIWFVQIWNVLVISKKKLPG